MFRHLNNLKPREILEKKKNKVKYILCVIKLNKSNISGIRVEVTLKDIK